MRSQSITELRRFRRGFASATGEDLVTVHRARLRLGLRVESRTPGMTILPPSRQIEHQELRRAIAAGAGNLQLPFRR